MRGPRRAWPELIFIIALQQRTSDDRSMAAQISRVRSAERQERMSRRSMIPKEHGAIAQLALPMFTALALGVSPAGAALACSASAAFVMHEPLSILLGIRGTRALREDGARARSWLLGLGAASLGLGALGAWLAPGATRAALVLPALLAAALGLVLRARKERTLGGELLASTALASLALPVAIAGGMALGRAFTVLGVWSVAFAASTVVVKGTIERRGRLGLAAAPLATLLLGILGASLGLVPTAAALALLPVGAAALTVALLQPPPAHLRRVGWALATASTATAIVLLWGLR